MKAKSVGFNREMSEKINCECMINCMHSAKTDSGIRERENCTFFE